MKEPSATDLISGIITALPKELLTYLDVSTVWAFNPGKATDLTGHYNCRISLIHPKNPLMRFNAEAVGRTMESAVQKAVEIFRSRWWDKNGQIL